MSFVITTCSPETVVQVSETRLSDLVTKRRLPGHMRKTFVIRGRQTHFVLGWIGLASTQFGHNTSAWLFKALGEMNAVELTIEEIADRLGYLATRRFLELSTPDEQKHTTFVMAGWQKGEPFICTVSNYVDVYNQSLPAFDLRHHIPTIREARNIFPKFESSIQRFREIEDRDYVVHVMGDFDRDDLEPHFRGLEGLLKKRASSQEISDACMQIVLEASEHSPETVGRTLVGVEMNSSGKMMWPFYTETDEIIVPPYLGLDGAHTGGRMNVTISGDEINVKAEAQVATFEKIEKAG
jgi:hypothetical protein